MRRILGGLSAALFTTLLIAACKSDDDAAAATPTTDAAVCNVVPSKYDDTCTSDSDCVFVPAGGNVCDDCQNEHPSLLYCTVATLPVKSADRYTADLDAAMGQPAFVASKAKCGELGCPLPGGTAQCIQNKCVIAAPDAGDAGGPVLFLPDAGEDAAADATDASQGG